MPDESSMSVSPDKVVDRLCRDPIGMALWRACIAEELAEVYRERITQLEQQKSPAAVSPPPRSE